MKQIGTSEKSPSPAQLILPKCLLFLPPPPGSLSLTVHNACFTPSSPNLRLYSHSQRRTSPTSQSKRSQHAAFPHPPLSSPQPRTRLTPHQPSPPPSCFGRGGVSTAGRSPTTSVLGPVLWSQEPPPHRPQGPPIVTNHHQSPPQAQLHFLPPPCLVSPHKPNFWKELAVLMLSISAPPTSSSAPLQSGFLPHHSAKTALLIAKRREHFLVLKNISPPFGYFLVPWLLLPPQAWLFWLRPRRLR